MKVAIIGCNGQLGTALQHIMGTDGQFTILCADLPQLDITDAHAVEHFVSQNKPDLLVNCAAYTAVDRAESEPEQCRVVNAHAVGNIGAAASRHGARVVHFSTDYVFDGTASIPYSEDSVTHPLSVYGLTKLEGERALFGACPDSMVLRTSWLYSPWGNNFVKTMLRLGRERASLKVVNDQIGSPTSALDLARAVRDIINRDVWKPGIFNFTDEGVASWYDFAVAIHEIAGIKSCNVAPCKTSEYPTAATRPHYSVLDKSKIKALLNIGIPHWRESLKEVVAMLEG